MLVNVVVAVLMKHLEDSNKEAQLEEMEEKAEMREREEANRRLSTASVGGDPGPNADTPSLVTARAHVAACMRGDRSEGKHNDDSADDLIRQVQVEDEECSHDNLLSMGRMLSLPSDNYVPPLRCSPYPPIGHEAYSGYSYSGTLVPHIQLNIATVFYCAVTTSWLL